MELPNLKDKEGNQVELIHHKKAKVKKGNKHLLDKLPMYANSDGEWFYEKKDVEKLCE